MMYPVLENEHFENMENIMRSVKPVLNFIKFLKAFCNADFARKSFSMVHKTQHFGLKAPR